MASLPALHRLYVFPALLFSIGGMTAWEPSLRPLAGGALVYAAMLVVFNKQAHSTLTKAFEGQHRNEQLLQRLGHEVRHDQLTGVLNRSALKDTAETARNRARQHHRGFGILFVDLDRFKHVNDGLGHTTGDDLLRSVARRLEGEAIGTGIVARVGGDEFVVLIDGLRAHDEAGSFALQVLDALNEPHHLGGHELAVSASIGLAWCEPGDFATSTEDLITHADVAMYRAKASGGARVVPFDGVLMGWHQKRSTNEWDLRKAIADGELFYVAQRVVSGDGTVTGCELLARWRRPDGTNVPPNTFIPLAEETGLVVDIGRWILNEAVELLDAWHRDPALNDLKVAINISGLHVRSTIVTDVAAALAGRKFDRSRLTIEITETHLMSDLDASRQVLQALGDLGVNIALDDFGTGYSSLAYFAAIPADIIKADKSLRGPARDRPQRPRPGPGHRRAVGHVRPHLGHRGHRDLRAVAHRHEPGRAPLPGLPVRAARTRRRPGGRRPRPAPPARPHLTHLSDAPAPARPDPAGRAVRPGSLSCPAGVPTGTVCDQEAPTPTRVASRTQPTRWTIPCSTRRWGSSRPPTPPRSSAWSPSR